MSEKRMRIYRKKSYKEAEKIVPTTDKDFEKIRDKIYRKFKRGKK